jgi:soluble lytic murein transglycosylase-like protein
MLAFPYNRIRGLKLGLRVRELTLAHLKLGPALLCMSLLFLVSLPAAAQIASTVDANGKVVFVNAEPPPEKKKPAPKKETRPTSEVPKEQKAGGLNAEVIGHPEASDSSANPNKREPVPPERLEHIVNEAAERHNLDPALVSSVIDVESNWNQTAISRKGALGLMQLIPSTAGEMGVRDAFDPEQNVEGGANYLRILLDRFHGDIPKSLAAYNAGPAAVERRGDIPNIPETRDYVKKVTADYFRRGSGRNVTLLSKPRIPVRRELDEQGHALFTNE